jgi:hypothetical protein
METYSAKSLKSGLTHQRSDSINELVAVRSNWSHGGLSGSQKSNKKLRSERYPSQYDDASVKTDITEADIQNYVRRVANKKIDETDYNCNNLDCDTTDVTEDCPQLGCYKQYLNSDVMEKMDPSKRVFYDNLKDLISSKTSDYREDVDSDAITKSRIDELLENRAPPCDFNQLENQTQLEDLKKSQQSEGVCSLANPNQCDRVLPNVDCGNRECYKQYLSDDLGINKASNGSEPSAMRVRFDDDVVTRNIEIRSKSTKLNDSSRSYNQNSGEFKKRYNTLIVNSDVSVPEFIDVLVVLSENPIKITLPELSGPSLASSVGNVANASNLLIKNLSLCSHQIVTRGNNKIDNVRTSVSVEPAGKKTLGAVYDSWILL